MVKQKDLLDAYKKYQVSIQIVQNIPSKNYPDNETVVLAKQAGAQVLSIDFSKLVGAGILHTKLIIVDRFVF